MEHASGLPRAAPRGPPPAGVRLEESGQAGEFLVADADFEVGDLVLRERFLLLGPTELPPLGMFGAAPTAVADVEMQGEGFPGVTSWDQLHMKLLFEFVNAEEDVQAEAVRMQDAMCAGETRQSIEQVAQWLSERQLPWLSELSFDDIFRLLRLFCVNSYPCRAAGSTSGLLKWGTMINHSCRPNVTFYSRRDGQEFEGCYRAVRPIKRGDVLGSSYMKPPVQLMSLVQRRRVLWCLKGFVCCCTRCCEEEAHGDDARAIPDTVAPQEEAQMSAEVVWTLFRHWRGFEEANPSTATLQERLQKLPKDHFARRALEALLLSLEGEFIAGARERPQLSPADALHWLRRVSELCDWLRDFRGEPSTSLVLPLAFGGLAPSIRDIFQIANAEGEAEDLRSLESWAGTMLALDAQTCPAEPEE